MDESISNKDFFNYLIIFLKTRKDIQEEDIQKLQNSYTENSINKVKYGFQQRVCSLLSPDNIKQI
ncbi:MAG: hypothetical protein Q9M15_08010 [Mariprofundaceae bacterium]|nr:hypothetical protein [Mariprofundaceae bacterium]